MSQKNKKEDRQESFKKDYVIATTVIARACEVMAKAAEQNNNIRLLELYLKTCELVKLNSDGRKELDDCLQYLYGLLKSNPIVKMNIKPQEKPKETEKPKIIQPNK